MASSQIAICNMALRHLGVGTEIQDIAERTKEARACVRFYDQVIEETLRDFPWPWATVIGTLALVAESPNADWSYSYRMPADCIRFTRILSGRRIDTAASRVAFRIMQDSQGPIVLCDVANAQAEWTTRVTNAGLFPGDFAQTAALYLAGMVAPSVTKGDDYKLGDRALKLYEYRKAEAWANAAQEQAADLTDNSSFMDARDAGDYTVRPLSTTAAVADDTDSDAVVA